MKTRNETTTAKSASTSRARVQSFMAIVGIMTAIICAVILMDARAAQRTDASEFNASKVSTLAATSQIVKARDLSVVSGILKVVKF